MFGKRPPEQVPEPEISGTIQTIPEVFYAGNDPIIYHTKETTGGREGTAPITPPLRKSSSSKTTPVTPRQRKKVYIIGGVVVFVLIIAGATWYFVDQERQRLLAERNQNPPPPPPVTTPATPPVDEVPVVVPTSTEVVATSTEASTPTTTPSPLDLPIMYPGTLLIDTPDFDADQLTDQEEEVFRTDGSVWDTDGDGYHDGREVFNLYNPTGTAPEKLIDSGLVREFISPTWQYRLYYPAVWETGIVDTDSRQVLFSSITGDYVEVRVIDREPGQSFADWFSLYASDQQYSSLREITNRFQEQGFERADGLVGYYVQTERVYVIVYHPSATATSVPFRNVVRMMIQSFRPSRLPGTLPSQQFVVTSTPSQVSTTPTSTDVENPETETTSTVSVSEVLDTSNTTSSEQAVQGG